MAEDTPLTSAQKQSIMKLFFERVPSAERRLKNIRLASFLSDDGGNEDEFYGALYEYSLEENWAQADADFEEFNLDGYSPDVEVVRDNLKIGDPPKAKRRPVNPRKKKS